MKNFLIEKNHTAKELQEIIDLSIKIKSGEKNYCLKDKSVALIFQKPSNRTRVSFEVGVYQLGGKTIDLKQAEIGLGEREAISDVARVLSRYVDLVMIRPLLQKDVEEFASYSTVPVINGLSEFFHPCQAMADILTIIEHKGSIKGKKIVFAGDGNNVFNSLYNAATILGAKVSIACPMTRKPRLDKLVSEPEILHDLRSAVADADVIYTDTWHSMGEDSDRIDCSVFQPFSITQEIMELAKPDAIFMHCLPAHRGQEVVDEVMESKQSVIFDQAENRMHAQKGIMAWLMA